MGMGPPSMGMGPPSMGMGRHPTLLLLLLLGAAGEWYDSRDDQLCSLAVEFSCQDGQPAYSVCRDNPCNGIHVDGDNVEHACGTDEHGCPLRARSWADDLISCDDVCARAGASCARAAKMNADPCASEAHEESELTCGQDIGDAGLTDPSHALCWCAQECTTTAAYYDGSQDLSAHDPDKCREHWCGHHDGDCCGDDHSTWCADGYTLVRGNEGDGCWPGRHGYRCLPPDATPAPTSSATPVPTQHVVLIDGTTPPEIVRAYNATAYDVCDAWGECPLNRAVCESDPELRDNCECASYDPWRPDCRYASCGQCNCDWWDNSGADECCSAHCWQECWEHGTDGLPGPGNATRNATDRATGTTCFNGSPLAAGETVLRCPSGQYSQHEDSCVCVADQTLPEPPRCLLRDPEGHHQCEEWDGEQHCWWEGAWHGWHVDGGAQMCDALRCDPATETIFFAGHRPWADHWSPRRESRKRNIWREERRECLVARADGAYARQGITQERSKWEAWMWKERGHWGRWQDVASPLGNASYYGRVVRACADECGGCAAIAASAEELRTLENLERAYGMSGGGPAVAPPGSEADAACFGKTFRGHERWNGRWFWISTGHALVIALLAVLCVVPPLTACCASHDWCPWYGPLQRARNNFAELCPALAKCLDFCCVGVCNRCDDWRKRCGKVCCRCCRREKPCPVVAAAGAVELAPLHLEVVAAGPPGTAMAVPLPGGGAVQVAVPEGLAAGATFAVAVPVTEQPVAAAPPAPRQLDDTLEVVARPRSVPRQIRLVLWKQLRVKYRSPFAILAQLLFPALWFVFVWMLYIFMARTFFPTLRWNKDHWNFACKRQAARTRAKGRMGSRERGDYISHGYLENYLAPIAFVPFLQVVVVGVVVEHRDKLVEAMRMAGLKPVSYWSATFIFEALITGFWSAFLVACVAVGGLFNAAGHHDDPFGILLALHYVYIIVLVSQSFAATMLPVLRSPTTAALYALIAQVGCLACYNVMVVKKEVSYKRGGTKKKVTRKVYTLFEASVESQRAASMVPQLGYSLLVDSFRSHRVRKCEVSAGYQGEVWRSKLMKCGWRVDRTWSSVAAWKNLTVPGDPLTPWCPGFGEDDGDDDDDDERRRRLDEEDGADQVCERRRRLVDADDDDDLDDDDREVCPNPTCPDGSAATCCDTADGDCDDGDDDWCCGTDFLCTNDSPDWAAHQGGVLCCSLGHAPTTPKTWPGTTGWCRSELDFEIGNYNGTECWAACEAMFGAELVAVDWDATDCYCQDACACMDDHLDPGVGLATRASLATLPDQCAYDFCKVEVRSEYPPFYGVTDTGQGPRPRDAWTGGIYGMLLLDVALYALVAWYLSQVFSAEGASKKWYFPFLPSTYGFGREEARGADVSEEDANPMLAAEEDEDDADAEAKFDPRPPGFRASIEVRRLSKTFGTHRAVDCVSLQLADSEIFCLLGHNGAGKTTTIGVLTGLLDPDYSTKGIAAFGRDVLAEGGMDFLRATLGVCPQHDVLFPRLTCREHVKFFSMLKGKSAERAARDADALLDVFHLKDRGRHLGSELSGGQKRKLSVSIALSGSSKFIVLDEPTAGMDPVARREFWSLLRGVRENRCLLLTTHHMEEAEALGDRVAIMAAGSVRCEGSVAFLTRRFGAGYTLKVDPMNDAAANALAKAGSSATASGGHQIPIQAAVAPLLAELDAAGVSYEASGTTLEDVFLAVGEDEVAHNVGAVKDWSQGSVRAGEMVSAAPKLSEERPGFEGHFRAVFTKRLKLLMNDLRLFLVPVRWVLAILRDFQVEGASRLLEKLGPHGGGARGVVLLLLPGLCSVIICALYRDKKLVSKSRHHADDLANFYVAVCLAGSSIFVAGIVAEPLVRERARRLRNLLSVSGLDARAYWLGTAAADYAILFVGVVVTLIALKSGSVARKADAKPKHFHKDYTKRELWVEDEWVVFVLILAPLAVVAFGHAGSHAFSEPVMTLAGFPVISIALLVAPLVVALMAWMLFGGVLIPRKRAPALKQMNLNLFELLATYAWLCTLASPAGALLMAMLNAAKIRLLPVRGSGFGKAFLGDPDRRIETVPGGAAQTSAPGAMDVVWPPMWASLLVLLLHALVFGAVAYAVDRMATRPLPFKKAKLSRRRRANLDPDVMAERRRTLALLVGHAAEATGDGTEVEVVVETEAALPPKPTPPWRRVAQRVADRLAAKVRAVRAAMTNRLAQNEDRAPDLKSAWPGLGAFEPVWKSKFYGAFC